MSLEDVFGRILGLKEPWYVEDVAFDTKKLEVDIYVGFRTGAQLPCPLAPSERGAVHVVIIVHIHKGDLGRGITRQSILIDGWVDPLKRTITLNTSQSLGIPPAGSP